MKKYILRGTMFIASFTTFIVAITGYPRFFTGIADEAVRQGYGDPETAVVLLLGSITLLGGGIATGVMYILIKLFRNKTA